MNKKRNIPGTNPTWGRKLPEGYDNSLVDGNGNNWDNGYNFDEKDSDDDETSFDKLDQEVPFDAKAAKKAREEAIKNNQE